MNVLDSVKLEISQFWFVVESIQLGMCGSYGTIKPVEERLLGTFMWGENEVIVSGLEVS